MHISTIPPLFNLGVVAAVACVAAWRGGPRERIMAGFMLTMQVNGHWVLVPAINDFPCDLIGLALALGFTVGSRSYWTIWAAAAMLVSLVGDVIYLANPGLGEWAYRSEELVFWYAAAAATFYGAVVHRCGDRLAARGPAGASRPEAMATAAPFAR
jgi:hypothetical protein